MEFWKNIVVKLWMTIIGVVAIVLLVLGLFLFRYIDTSFPELDDQWRDLESLTFRIAESVSLQNEDNNYVRAVNDLLYIQQIGLIAMEPEGNERQIQSDEHPVTLADVLTENERAKVLAGEVLQKRFSIRGPKGRAEYMAVAVPVTDASNTEVLGGMILYQPYKSSESLQNYVKQLFAFATFIGFSMTTFFAFFLITRLTKPLKQLKHAAGLITRGDYSTRVVIESQDELGELAQTFNLMGEQLEENIKALNNEKNNLHSVLHSMSDGVIAFDTDGKLIFTNPWGERILEEWNSIQWSEPDPDHLLQAETIPEPLRMLYEQVVEQSKPVYTKIHVQQGVWSVVMAPLNTHNVVRGAVVVLRDVTEEFRLDKLRKDFVANVSHELRTPLSMLQGYSEALIDDIVSTPEDRKELAQIIHDESLRMGRLVKDLLDLARMEAGHMEMHMGPVQLEPLFRRVHRKFYTLCKERGIELKADFPPENVEMEQGDQDRLEQVLTNLLDNAIRHTPEGRTITLRFQTIRHHDAPAALIEIEDEGQGIPQEDVPYIFERFYKADKARTRGNSGGTGLGLAIVKNIIDAHKGSVQVRSTVGQGTTFSVILPLSIRQR